MDSTQDPNTSAAAVAAAGDATPSTSPPDGEAAAPAPKPRTPLSRFTPYWRRLRKQPTGAARPHHPAQTDPTAPVANAAPALPRQRVQRLLGLGLRWLGINRSPNTHTAATAGARAAAATTPPTSPADNAAAAPTPAQPPAPQPAAPPSRFTQYWRRLRKQPTGAAPTAQTVKTVKPANAAPASPRQRVQRLLGRGLVAIGRSLRWFGLWLPGALLALLVAAALALWFWSATPGSLATTLTWVQNYSASHASIGLITADTVQGSLRAGGTAEQLRWTRAGLSVHASGVRLRLGPRLWTDALLGRGLHLDELHIDRLHIDDQRPPRPTEVLESLTLPLAITLPWSVNDLTLSGAQSLQLRTLRGVYRYGPSDTPLAPGVLHTHRLTLESLRLADGHYRAQATLGAQAPMPLTLDLQGSVPTQIPGGSRLLLQATAQLRGSLSGPEATLDLSARAQSSADSSRPPTLQVQARVMPWATQPLERADASAHQLNLASLWPQAPSTALSGTLQAHSEGTTWRANVRLDNSASGPADRLRLPLQSLQAQLTQQGSRWTLSGLDAQVSGGGRLQGNAQLHISATTAPSATRADAWQGQLRISNVNPALLWSTLAPAALDGTLSAHTARAGTQPVVDLSALIQPSGRQPVGTPLAGLRLRELRLQGQWQPRTQSTPDLLRLQQARIQLADAQLQASGEFSALSRQFDGQLALQWPGAQAQWQGLLGHNTGEGKIDLQIDDALRTLNWVRSLQTLPVLGPPLQAWLNTHPGLSTLGRASLQAQWTGGLGSMGYPAPADTPNASAGLPRLKATLDVPELVLQSSPTAPNGNNSNSGNNTQTNQISLGGLRVVVDGRLDDLQIVALGTITQPPWSARLDTQGRLQLQTPPVASGPINAQTGQLDINRLQLRLSNAARKDRITHWSLQNTQPLTSQWRTTDQGLRLDAGAGGLHLLPTLHSTRPTTAANPTPATPDLGNTPLVIGWDSLIWQAHTLQSRGRLSELPLAWMDVLGTAEGASTGPLTRAGLSGNLVFEGQWDMLLSTNPQTPLRLSAKLQRSRGDLIVQTDGNNTGSTPNSQRLQAGIQQAELNLSAQGTQVQASLRWVSDRLGQVSVDLSTEINPYSAPGPPGSNPGLSSHNNTDPANPSDPFGPWWPPNATLRGSASAQLPQVGVWSALAPPGWRMQGTLQAQAELSGTRSAPQWSGQLQADQLGLRSVVDGFAFSNGQLRATLADDKITIQRFSLQGPRGSEPGGTLEATGSAEWRTPEGSTRRQAFIELQANADHLRVSNRADRRITLSGQINTQLAGPRLRLRGQLTADTALFVLPDELAPTLGSDVVQRGTFSPPNDADAEPVQPDIQIDLDLGPQFDVRGRGLQTRLSGQLSVRSTPAMPTPRVLGEVRAVSGTYRAYGQQLSIDTGVLRFTGPYDDPTLDILAMRPQPASGAQRVGVQITGSAQSPRVRLYSDPELPDSEKLAWLVLGRPATGAGAEAAVLQQAAMALLTRNNSGADAGFASLIGLDELGFTGQATNTDGTTTAAALTVGKRISNDLYLAYERSLAGTMGTVSIFYDLSRRLTLRARAGEENAVDLIFTLRYD